MDGGGVDVGVGLVVKVGQGLGAGEVGILEPAGGASGVAVVALGHQQFGEEPSVAELVAFSGLGDGGELARARWAAAMNGRLER